MMLARSDGEGSVEKTTPPGDLPSSVWAGGRLGSLIGLVFGVIYLEANAGSWPRPVGLSIRLAGLVAGGAVLATIMRPRHVDGAQVGANRSEPAPGFGRRYWMIVGAEAIALVIGLAMFNGPLHAARAAVAWVSFVVGVHFFPLSALFRARLFVVLGTAIAGCGLAGLALAWADATTTSIAVVSGIVPGVLLVGSGWYGGRAG